jgi:protein SCO1/2
MSRLGLVALLCLLLGALGGVLAAIVTSKPPEARASFTPPLEPPPNYRLKDETGKWQTPGDHRGKVVVLTFLYATCPDLCPDQAQDIRRAVERVNQRGVHIVSISVDPVGDTPARAKGFLERQGLAKMPSSFLVGTRAQLAPVWAAYGIVPVTADDKKAAEIAQMSDDYFKEEARKKALGIKEKEQKYVPSPEEIREAQFVPPDVEDPYPTTADHDVYRGRRRHYTLDFEHSAYVLLIDKHGRQRVGFPFEQLEPELLARDIRMLMSEP